VKNGKTSFAPWSSLVSALCGESIGGNQGRSAETAKDRARGAERILQLLQSRRTIMSFIKKAPAIVTLEVQVEEPVKQLLEDYARFIESSPDHVVNSVIKRNLWRDQDYRKWREQQRAQVTAAAKTTTPEGE
jgi:hypothetical protein